MEKKMIVFAALLTLAAATILQMSQPLEMRENSQQSGIAIQEKPTTDLPPRSVVPSDVEESCKGAAERSVRVKSEDRSSDTFLDRIESVKELLSDDSYQSLIPNLDKDEFAIMREENKRIKKEETTETQIISISSIIDRITDDDFEIYVIYTAQVQRADGDDANQYLVRVHVQQSDERTGICKMVEESSLGHGSYEKQKEDPIWQKEKRISSIACTNRRKRQKRQTDIGKMPWREMPLWKMRDARSYIRSYIRNIETLQ